MISNDRSLSWRAVRSAVALAAVVSAVAVAIPLAAAEPAWQALFDGRDLGRWRPTAFGGEGEVAVVDQAIRVSIGSEMSGITWGGDFPKDDYELALEARRDEGIDFFCGLTFPVADDFCSFIVGGWGGTVVGLSSIDGRDAADNATTTSGEFVSGRWYRIRVRVSSERIECFLDDERVVDQARQGSRFSIRDEMLPARPLGIATYATSASLRAIRWRPLSQSP
jgi:hypothetical protein